MPSKADLRARIKILKFRLKQTRRDSGREMQERLFTRMIEVAGIVAAPLIAKSFGSETLPTPPPPPMPASSGTTSSRTTRPEGVAEDGRPVVYRGGSLCSFCGLSSPVKQSDVTYARICSVCAGQAERDLASWPLWKVYVNRGENLGEFTDRGVEMGTIAAPTREEAERLGKERWSDLGRVTAIRVRDDDDEGDDVEGGETGEEGAPA